jgi:1-phosphatidylinositol-3-phosphate 5-kinase
METFAPVYFDYMSSAVTANVGIAEAQPILSRDSFHFFQRPTLLAKIFGCYKLTFKKAGKDKGPAKSKSMNLLVMENLLYDRRYAKVSKNFC